MTPPQTRKRLVCFRISEDEYRCLRSACGVVGAKSVSDLARTAVAQLIGPYSGPIAPQLLQRVRDLEKIVQMLWMQLENTVAAANHTQDPDGGPQSGGAG